MNYSINMMYARSRNNVIGYKGRLPDWKIKNDLAWFKQQTAGAILIMGKKTWYSLPVKLPGRFSIVITSKPEELQKIPYDPNLFNPETLAQIAVLRPDVMPEQMPVRLAPDDTARSFEEALQIAKHQVRMLHHRDWAAVTAHIPKYRKIFIIGGASVFKEAETVVDTIYETVVESSEVMGDVFYTPGISKDKRELVSTIFTTALLYDSETFNQAEPIYQTVPAQLMTWMVNG